MADELRAHYDDLQQISQQFVHAANGIEQMHQKVRSSFSKLQDKGWIGQGANAFFDEMEGKVNPSQLRLQQALEQAGQTIQKLAQSLRQAEEQASALFKHG
ncbi:MAG TPA: WXG100 family type VII secretion target [Chloroflexota bacterium]|nr:WXG100 family type VII secretion target [Chloroflexota bacterium]